jgi:undecaprenyl diphosphate synthase
LEKEAGYEHGVAPGIRLFEECRSRGIEEITVFCFTQDNTKRPARQTAAFTNATVALASQIASLGAAIRVVGDQKSKLFPQALAELVCSAGSRPKVNLLVNYGWQWDLDGLREGRLRSSDISRLDLIVRWGGGRRLSGFLPVQSVYADIFVHDELWPDYQSHHLDAALAWFKHQDRTLGG